MSLLFQSVYPDRKEVYTAELTIRQAISSELAGESTLAFWVGIACLLSNAICQSLIAPLSDVFGRLHLLFPSVLLFTIGNIVAAVAHNYATLVAGRVIQGIGGGGISTLIVISFMDIVPLKFQLEYQRFIRASWAAGTILGPVVGGAFAQFSTWVSTHESNFYFLSDGS